MNPGVNGGLTANRPTPAGDNHDYHAFTRRILRAYARRIATGDIEALPALVGLADDLETAITDAVVGLRAFGYSWTEIATRLGVSRQAAHQRWAGGDQP